MSTSPLSWCPTQGTTGECRGGGGGWIAGAFLWGEGEGEALSTRRCITCRERGVDGGGEEVSIYTTCRGGG